MPSNAFRPSTVRALPCVLALVAGLAAWPAPAQDGPPLDAAPEAQRQEAQLPPAQTTEHQISLDGEDLRFTATAGALPLRDAEGALEAEIAFTAYTVEGAEPAGRPVTFVVNGGPGAASAYLQLGALGPWAVGLDAGDIVPSDAPGLADNPDTWLGFTDLVFLDPVGAGFSRLADDTEGLRDRYLSIDGDIEALANAIRRWSVETGRIASPRYFVGESYGGFRGPLLAETLLTEHGLALSGLVLVSPVLDFGWWEQPAHSPLAAASLLPSLAAAAQEADGSFSAAELVEAEAYAAADYVTDLLRGVEDADALDRVVDRVTRLTGLDRATVAGANGRIDRELFAEAFAQAEGRRLSVYDAAVAGPDPFPERTRARRPEPLLDALTAPLTEAMLRLHAERLDWLPDRRYRLLNRSVNRSWEWGDGRGEPEAVSALRRVLALDPGIGVLVVHGYTDLVTPYFASELILRQVVDGADDRVRHATYRGGHMFYTRPASRAALRRDAEALFEAPAG